MCGFTCVLSARDKDFIVPMTEAIVHRGPDSDGFFRDDRIALGARRLSINDIDGGRQPISNETDDVHLVCNGEIYNSPGLRRELEARGHRFRTGTDIEVILHLYEDFGDECVKRLQGMFGFSLWDARKRRLLIARDHLGQKPVFYYEDPERFMAASEVKAIAASGKVRREADLDALWHYVALRYLPDDYTLFKGIRKLPAGSCLTVEDGKVRTWRYWDLSFADKTAAPERDIIEQLDGVVRDTVKSHLLSDVRVGAFLSGGIDSGLISAIMAEMRGDEPVPTFTIGVKEHGFNELPYAEMVAARYGMEHHKEIVEVDLVGLLPEMIHHMDEPVDPYGAGIFLVSRLAARHVKVVLTGDGGDENFAGYDRFAGERILDWYCMMPEMFRREIVQRLVDRIPESFGYKSFAQKAQWMNRMSLYPKDERYAHSMAMLRFSRDEKDALFTDAAKAALDDRDTVGKMLRHFNAGNAEDLVDRMLHTDLMTRMPDHLLVTVDRMSMAHSIETRAPLIDHKLVEFAATIPGAMKLKRNRLKHLLRKVSERYLPRQLIYRRKQGFSFPLGMWMRTSLRGFVEHLIATSRFVEIGMFDRAYMRGLMDEHVSGRVDHTYRLWLLVSLEFWYRLKIEETSAEDLMQEVEEGRRRAA